MINMRTDIPRCLFGFLNIAGIIIGFDLWLGSVTNARDIYGVGLGILFKLTIIEAGKKASTHSAVAKDVTSDNCPALLAA